MPNPNPTPQTTARPSLGDEIDRATKRALGLAIIDPKREFTESVYPLMKMMVDLQAQVMVDHERRLQHQEERMGNAEGAIGELATAGDSIVLPDLAAQIDNVLMRGLQICNRVDELKLDDDDMAMALKRYRAAVEELRTDLDDVTVEDDDDDNEEEGE